jgi:thiol-disulfide isomerase/thioredoxin
MLRRALIGLMVASLAAALTGCSSRSSVEEGVLALDQPAPGFTLPDLSGQRVSLGDFKGKVVLLDFWATWCGPCRMTMPLLEKLQQDVPQDLVLLAINLQDTKEDVQRFVAARQIKSRVLLDGEGEVGRAYQSESIPMQVVIDREGGVRYVKVGFSPQMGSELRREVEKLR